MGVQQPGGLSTPGMFLLQVIGKFLAVRGGWSVVVMPTAIEIETSSGESEAESVISLSSHTPCKHLEPRPRAINP